MVETGICTAHPQEGRHVFTDTCVQWDASVETLLRGKLENAKAALINVRGWFSPEESAPVPPARSTVLVIDKALTDLGNLK